MMLLQDYRPHSCLEVKRTQVLNPCFPVIDVHTHFGKGVLGNGYESRYDTNLIISALRSCGVKHVVNLDFGFGKAREEILEKTKDFKDFFIHFGNVDLSRSDEPGFEDYAFQSISDGIRLGMKGLKFFKTDTGLGIKDHSGKYIGVNDRRIACLFDIAADFHLPVLMHVADPVAFFSPVDRYNERYEELSEHPDWSFCKKEYYSFQKLMEMQEQVIDAHPNTTFIVAHVGSYSENLQRVSLWLERYPNMYIDIAARISELGRQPYSSKAFLEKYADRILFGTDYFPTAAMMHPNYYRFLETLDEYFSPEGNEEIIGQGRWMIYGVGLSPRTLAKIYYKNAANLLQL